MTAQRRSLIVTLALALLAGLAGALMGVSMSQSSPPRGDALHRLLHDELGLSAAQERRIEVEERLFANRKANHERAIRDANAALAAAITTSQRNGPEVQRAIGRVQQQLGAYQIESVSHIFRMRVVLTPEQARKFDTMVSAALTSDAR